MSDYMPTTDEMREWYVRRDRTGRSSRKEYELEFDRWLAQHDRKVRAQALEDAADVYQTGGWAVPLPGGSNRPALILGMVQRASDWLRVRAEKERQSGNPATPAE